MTKKFSEQSKKRLNKAHPFLRLVLEEALSMDGCPDFSVVETKRGATKQNKYYREGKSHLRYPFSKHNRTLDPALVKLSDDLSDAVDVIPYPGGYNDKEGMLILAGCIMAKADSLGVRLRWGGDWNTDGVPNNKRDDFFDCWHFEIIF